MNQSTGRASLLGIAGGYLIYMAYELLRNLIDNVPTTMPRFVQILFIALFTGIGIVLLVYAWKVWKKGKEDQDQNPVDIEEKEKDGNKGKNGPGE